MNMALTVDTAELDALAERVRDAALADGHDSKAANNFADGTLRQVAIDTTYTRQSFLSADTQTCMLEDARRRWQYAKSREGRPWTPKDHDSLLSKLTQGALASDNSNESQTTGLQPVVGCGEHYLPCSIPTEDLEYIDDFSKLKEETHHRGFVLTVRRVGDVVVGKGSTLIGVKDSKGAVEQLQLCHRDGQELKHDRIRPGGVINLREPYLTFSHTEKDVAELRVDHPDDLEIVLNGFESKWPGQWYGRREGEKRTAAQWKDQGNTELKQGALFNTWGCYSQGLHFCQDQSELQSDLRRNRSYVNLKLGRYGDAILDTCDAFWYQRKSMAREDEVRIETNRAKTLFRSGCAYYHYRDFERAARSFKLQLTMEPGDDDGGREMAKAFDRLREENGRLDFTALRKACTSSSSRMDVGNFLRNVEVWDDDRDGRRTVLAGKDFKAGELVMYEKALCAAWAREKGAHIAITYDAESDSMSFGCTWLWEKVVGHCAQTHQ